MSMSSGGAIYVDDERDMPSESDDEDERLDCVHDIHQRQNIDQFDVVEDGVNNYYSLENGEDPSY